MKKRNLFVAFIFTLVCLFGLCSCENFSLDNLADKLPLDKLPFDIGQKKTEAINEEEANEFLNIDYEALVSAYQDKTITKDLALPLELENGSTVVWTSSNKDAVLDNGNLVENTNGGLTQSGDLPTSTLTAQISHKGTSEVKEHSFTVTINKLSNDASTVIAAKAALFSRYEGVSLSGYKVNGLTESGDVKSYTFTFDTREDVQIEYLNTERLTFTGNVAEVKRPTSAECPTGKDYVVETIKAKITLNSISIVAEIPCQITKQTALLTVGGLREIMASNDYIQKQDTYVFRGTVSLVWEMNIDKGMQGFYVQDQNGAILVYSASINDKSEAVEVGDEVLVTATTCFYNGLAETSSVSAVQILVDKDDNTERYNALETIEVNATSFKDDNLLGKDNFKASINELIFDRMTDTSNNTITEITTTSVLAYFYFREIKGKQVCINLDKYSTDYSDIAAELNALNQGDIVTVEECALSWYSDGCSIKIANKGKIKIVETAELTETEVYKLDKLKLASIAPEKVYAVGTFDLASSLPFGTLVEWTLAPDSNASVSIVDGQLVITEFSDPFEIKLIAEMVKEGGGTTMEFTSTAVNPITIAEAKAMIDSETGLKEGTAIKGFVADIILGGQVVVLSDGTNLLCVTMPEEVEVAKLQELNILLSSGRVENGVYKVECSSVITSESTTLLLDAQPVELANLTNEFKKVEIKEVTVANGKASVSDTVTVEFVANESGNVKLADGTYSNLKGYTAKKDDNTIVVYVLGVVGTEGTITINATSVLGYDKTNNIPYGSGNAEIEGILFDYTELGAYGAGIQWRVKGDQFSSIKNVEAINAKIEKIVIEFTTTKTVYSADHRMDASFGTTPECSDYTVAIGNEEGQYEIVITPDTENYTYFYINQFYIDQSQFYKYSQYIESITIYFVDGSAE